MSGSIFHDVGVDTWTYTHRVKKIFLKVAYFWCWCSQRDTFHETFPSYCLANEPLGMLELSTNWPAGLTLIIIHMFYHVMWCARVCLRACVCVCVWEREREKLLQAHWYHLKTELNQVFFDSFPSGSGSEPVCQQGILTSCHRVTSEWWNWTSTPKT